ncbi:MAG TPA: hypothetical protein VGM37_01780 [Armatimonadota bacterium]|jgi:N-dimethylarginine dimethylaminohydrolase
MAVTYTVTGVQTDAHTLHLDDELPLMNQRLRIVIEPAPSEPPNRYAEVMAAIREAQEQRNHTPRSKEEIDAYLEAERSSWDSD